MAAEGGHTEDPGGEKPAEAIQGHYSDELLGVGIECKRRADRFLGLAEHHRSRIEAMLWGANGTYSGHEGARVHYYHPDGKEYTDREMGRLYWHAGLKKKYLDASRHPWLPVAPDPPAPW